MAGVQKREIWKVNLYTLWCTQVLVNMGFGMVIPFVPYYLEELADLTAAQLNFYTGLSSTLPAIAMTFASPIWGKLSDLYGRKMMLIRAMICGALALFLMGLANTVFVFLLLRIFQGIFTGTISASMALVSAHTPEDQMAYALGFMTSSNFLGFALGPVIGSPLVEFTGYRVCFFTGGALLAIGTLFVILLVKEDPNTFGAALRLKQEAEQRLRAAAQERPADGADAEAHSAKKGGAEKKTRDAGFLTLSVVMTLVALLIVRVGRLLFSPFTAIFVRETLGTMEGATMYTGLISMATCAATAVSSVTLTRLGDHHDKFGVALVLAVLSTLIAAVLPVPLPLWMFIVVYAMFYFVAGAIEPILTSALSQQTDPGHRGALFGVTGAINSLSMVISPMVGASISTALSTRAILGAIPFFMAAQVIFLVIEAKVKKKKGIA